MTNFTKDKYKIKQITIQGIDITIRDDEEYNFYNSMGTVFISGELDSDCYSFNQANFQEGDTLLDIGGNVGLLGIYLAKKYPFLKIYSYEADPKNFAFYQEHIILNDLQNHVNLKVFNQAVYSNRKGIYSLGKDYNNINYDHNSGSNTVSTISGGFFVETVTLDDILHIHKLNKLKFLKIDVEGSEYAILLSSKLIKNQQVIIENFAIELHYSSHFRCKKFLKFLNDKIYLPQLYRMKSFYAKPLFVIEIQLTSRTPLKASEKFFDKYLYYTDSYLKYFNTLLLKKFFPRLDSAFLSFHRFDE